MRRRLRALLPRLHLLPALSGWGDIVVVIGADAELIAALAAEVAPDGDVIVIDPSVDVLEQLRAAGRAPAVWYLVGEAEVLPLPDESVAALRSALPATAPAAEEWFRVLGAGGEVASAGSGEPALNSGERVLSEAGFVDVAMVREDAAPSLVARKA